MRRFLCLHTEQGSLMYAGVDTAAYPGDDWARRVYNETNIWYLSYYLGGQNAAKGTETWRGHRSFLTTLGFGLIPIYVGQQVDSSQFYARLTAKRGHADGIMAALLMSEEGFPSNSVCYLDVEGRTASLKLTAYVSAWIDGLQSGGYRAGVYCDATAVAPALLSKRSDFYLWAVPVGTDIWVSVSPRIGEGGRLIYPTYDPRDTHANAFAVQYAEAGFAKDPPGIWGVNVDLNSCLEKDPSMPTEQGEKVVTGQDIVNAAYELKGAPYRAWTLNAPLPMWLNDGAGNPPPASHILSIGCMCADLISYAMLRCGLPTVFGTEAFEDFLVNTQDFDPSSPGEPGAIAYDPYISSESGNQGHIAAFVDEHYLIQALDGNPPYYGVTDQFTDQETYSWGGDTLFTRYGFLPNVVYRDTPSLPQYRYQKNGYLLLDRLYVTGTAGLAAPWGEIDDKGKITVRDGSDYGVKL